MPAFEPSGADQINCSVCLPAYNEEASLGQLLQGLLSQRLRKARICEIVVVASGCTDGTERVAREFASSDERVKLISQPRREGKASAINAFLARARGDICILESTDTIPEPDAIERLIEPFSDPAVGAAGARPVPTDRPDTFLGYAARLRWRLHDEICQVRPKIGELIAFRRCIDKIPADTAVDEAAIEASLHKLGYRITYARRAIVRNKAPSTVEDYLKQRRRIIAGHLHLRKTQAYTPSTMNLGLVFRFLSRRAWSHLGTLCRLVMRRRMARALVFSTGHARRLVWTTGAIGLDLAAQILGAYDFYVCRRNPFIWDVAASTKGSPR